MTKFQRIRTILGGILAILFTPFLLLDPDAGCVVIILLLGIAATAKGIQMLFYYLTMARHAIGGASILFGGIILLDFGIFTIGLADIPKQYIMLYLLLTHLFSGLIDILRALEIRKFSLGSWRFKLLVGLGNIALGLVCLVKINSSRAAVAAYCFCVVWNALGRILSALRPSAVLYVAQP